MSNPKVLNEAEVEKFLEDCLVCTCGDTQPYRPAGICAPMQPIDSCMNCYPRGRPLTDDEKLTQEKRNERGLVKLGMILQSQKTKNRPY